MTTPISRLLNRSLPWYADPDHKLAKALGGYLRDQRLGRGWSQVNLAQRARISPGTLSRVELGKVNARAATLAKIYAALRTHGTVLDDPSGQAMAALEALARSLME